MLSLLVIPYSLQELVWFPSYHIKQEVITRVSGNASISHKTGMIE